MVRRLLQQTGASRKITVPLVVLALMLNVIGLTKMAAILVLTG